MGVARSTAAMNQRIHGSGGRRGFRWGLFEGRRPVILIVSPFPDH
jgi:hypothetical protein